MRQPSIGRLIALLIGATVVLLLTIDTTMACRFFLRHRICSPCPPVPACRVAPPIHCGDVIVSGPVTYGQPIDSCCGAGEVVVGSHVIEGQVIEEHVVEGHVIQAEPAPTVSPADDVADVPDAPTPAPMPQDLDATPAEDSFVEPAIVEEPADDIALPDDVFPADEPTDAFAEPAPADLPADELPADDLPADDLFGTPADDAPADDAPADDLFDEPAADTPAEPAVDDLFNDAVPAEEMPADDLDVFDQPATDAPADDLFGAPADADAGVIEDTFAPPAAQEGTGELPGFDDPLPADEPADAVPTEESDGADSLDDLFGGAGNVSNTEPRTAAAVDTPTGDRFEGLDAPVEDAAPAADDLFDAPTEQPAPQPGNGVDDLDDLFGAQPKPTAADPAQSTQPVADATAELPVRVWTDNTGHYQTLGRLVKVSPTHVRLLKDNGRFSTVPKSRLSEADMAYVREVTQQLGVEYFDQVARR